MGRVNMVAQMRRVVHRAILLSGLAMAQAGLPEPESAADTAAVTRTIRARFSS